MLAESTIIEGDSGDVEMLLCCAICGRRLYPSDFGHRITNFYLCSKCWGPD